MNHNLHLGEVQNQFYRGNDPVYTSINSMPKLNEFGFKFLHHPLHSQDLVPSVGFHLSNLDWWLQGQRFALNRGVITQNEAYFEYCHSNSYNSRTTEPIPVKF